MASAPSPSVPIRFPCSTFPDAPSPEMTTPVRLAEMTLAPPSADPPMVLSECCPRYSRRSQSCRYRPRHRHSFRSHCRRRRYLSFRHPEYRCRLLRSREMTFNALPAPPIVFADASPSIGRLDKVGSSIRCDSSSFVPMRLHDTTCSDVDIPEMYYAGRLISPR